MSSMVTRPEFPYLFAVLFACEVAGRCSSSFLQGHPPSLRFGHPDVTTDDTAPPRHAHTSPERRVAIPSGSDIRVPPRTLSAAKQGEAERPGTAGAPAGAEEGYSVPTHPAPVGTRTITAFRAESMRPSFSKRKQPCRTRKHERGAASHLRRQRLFYAESKVSGKA